MFSQKRRIFDDVGLAGHIPDRFFNFSKSEFEILNERSDINEQNILVHFFESSSEQFSFRIRGLYDESFGTSEKGPQSLGRRAAFEIR